MSPESARLIESYRQRYRYVLVNLGDVMRHPEAAVTASRCDGVVVVLRAGLSQKDELRGIQRLLLGLKVGLSGVVLARAATRQERRRA
jgi:Mrp family chromosome partitioning ATPase